MLLTLIGFVIYLFNDEKFYSEYWLQKKIDRIGVAEQALKNESQQFIKYQFYYDKSVDVEFTLYDNGQLMIKKNTWLTSNDSTNITTHYYKVDKQEFIKLENEFLKNWQKSEEKNTDDHLSGIYYVLTYQKSSNIDNVMKIEFYNFPPSKTFIDFKNKILKIVRTQITQNSR